MAGAGISLKYYAHSHSGKVLVSPILLQVILGAATFLCSIGGSMFVAGVKWARINDDIRSIDRRLAAIEGMFTLTWKDKHE